MAYYITSYNGAALSDYGAVTPGHSGLLSGPSLLLSKFWTPGAARPHVQIQRRDRAPLDFRTVISGDTHAELLTNLAAVKGILFPDDDDYHALITADWPTQQFMAKPTGFPVVVDYLPGEIDAVQLQIPMDVWPYREDVSATSTHITAASQIIANGGDMRCYPTFTCEVNDTMASGLTFTVGSITFEYEGALVATDSLVVDSDQDCPDVELNGTRDWANCADDMAVLPFLAKGNNLVWLSDHTKFHLTVAYKQRYW